MHYTTDFLIIGSGIAGLQFALQVVDHGDVTIVTKRGVDDTNTWYAQGGIAGVMAPDDSTQAHVQDTLEAGRGLCDEEAVDVLVNEGPPCIRELYELGVRFSRRKGSQAFGNFDLVKEGGHHKARIAHVKDYTGKEIEQTLIDAVTRDKRITILEHHYAIDLVVETGIRSESTGNACYGAYVYDGSSGETNTILAGKTCIAAGSLGNIFQHTTNPEIATGDGIAMAYRAGISCANMEFVQFHPTTLYHPDGDSFLISEALRGFGAELKDRNGRAFMNEYHPMASLAPRDVVARAIDQEMKRAGDACVYLDVRHIKGEKTKKNFPSIYAKCKELGLDITKEPIPVVPAAHYICGGVAVDMYSRTGLDNCYVCGESACTGVHGANRLASNSLLEALVFSRRAAIDAVATLNRKTITHVQRTYNHEFARRGTSRESVLLWHTMKEIQSTMWNYVGIVRSTYKLKRAISRINILKKEVDQLYRTIAPEPLLLTLRNSVTVSRLVILCALRRRESRGAHYTIDYPARNDRYWKKNTMIRKPSYL